MSTAFLRNSIVVLIGPDGYTPPANVQYDASRDGTGATIGDTWNGSAYVAPPRPAVEVNRAAIESQADSALTSLRQFRDLANPTNAQTVAAVKLLCRVAISLIRLQLWRMDGTE